MASVAQSEDGDATLKLADVSFLDSSPFSSTPCASPCRNKQDSGLGTEIIDISVICHANANNSNVSALNDSTVIEVSGTSVIEISDTANVLLTTPIGPMHKRKKFELDTNQKD